MLLHMAQDASATSMAPTATILRERFIVSRWRGAFVNALVRFTGNSTATARDPARGGTTYGPLEVMADLKEPVSALKARMVQKAAESGFVGGDDKQR